MFSLRCLGSFEPIKFNYEFNDFVAKSILSDNDIYGLYKMYESDRHFIINSKHDFDSHICNFYSDSKNLMPKKQRIKQGYVFGDGNDTYIFVEYDTIYVMYKCFGS